MDPPSESRDAMAMPYFSLSFTLIHYQVGNPATQTGALRQQDGRHNLGKSAQVALVSRGDPLTELVKQLKMQVGHETGTLTGLVAF
jgi:hypothetical protein